MTEHETASFFERLKRGLEDSIAFSRGELTLKTTTLPMPPPKAEAQQIAGLRRRLRMSQLVFAATLNVSYKTVQSWEQGLRQPSDAALRLLQIIESEPKIIERMSSWPSPARNGRPSRRRPQAIRSRRQSK